MTDAGRFDLDENFAVARSVEIDFGNFERLSCGDGDGGLRLHPLGLPERQPCAKRRRLSGATSADIRKMTALSQLRVRPSQDFDKTEMSPVQSTTQSLVAVPS